VCLLNCLYVFSDFISDLQRPRSLSVSCGKTAVSKHGLQYISTKINIQFILINSTKLNNIQSYTHKYVSGWVKTILIKKIITPLLTNRYSSCQNFFYSPWECAIWLYVDYINLRLTSLWILKYLKIPEIVPVTCVSHWCILFQGILWAK